jgi:PAS domain S-box-containing protein
VGTNKEKKSKNILNTAIIGGGANCIDFLKNYIEGKYPNLKIICYWDQDINDSCFQYASSINIFTTTELDRLLELDDLCLILEFNKSLKIKEKIHKNNIHGLNVINNNVLQVFLDNLQIQEKDPSGYSDRAGNNTQVILDSLPYRIKVINMNMSIETVNQTFLNEYKLSIEDVAGKPCYEVMDHLKRPCGKKRNSCYIEEQLEEIREKGLFSTYEEYIDEKGKTCFDVLTLAPIFDEDGNIIQILEASRDVTERFTLEREAEKSNTLFQNVIESTVDGIVMVDTKGNVLIFNEGMEKLTGYTAEDMVSRGHITSFYDLDTAKENMLKMRSDKFGPPGKLNPTSMSITTKDGEEIPVTLSASLVSIDGEEVGSVGVFTDMREILQMRKDLEEAHLQLVQSEKIASVGRMAAGVAHEINNPLSGILIFAELLKGNLKDDSQNSKDIQEIIDQTLRCKKIVAELLEFSRQSVGKVSSFSVQEMIDKSLNILVNQAIFQNITVQKKIERNMPDIAGDAGQLQQVFTNLFVNAADAMEGKGKLTIEGAYDQGNNRFVLSVSDTGPGIPEKLKEKIFDIFFSTKPVGKGTGLGLSICQNIVKLHGGSIVVETPSEGGTKFIVYLPLGFMGKPLEEPVFLGLDD